MSRAWVEQGERGTSATLWLIRWIALHLGRTPARILLHPITAYYFLTSARGRSASRRFLARVGRRPPRWWHVARHMHCFAATILDRVFLLAGRYRDFDIRVSGSEIVERELAHGRGCILLGSHLGSFEVLRAAGVIKKRQRVRVLMYPDHNQIITQLLHALNPTIAETVIPIGTPETLLHVRDALEQGYVVGMLGDRVARSDKVVTCEFLGSAVQLPAGPARLALILDAPVVLFFGLYRGGKRYDIHFELLCSTGVSGTGGRDEIIRDLTQRYADRLAHYATVAPYNWFNFYDYWESKSAPR